MRAVATSKEKGFTLIELLVVISVIAVLMSLMMPALVKAKAAVKDSMDISNRHQFALFFKLWTDEHDGCSGGLADVDAGHTGAGVLGH